MTETARLKLSRETLRTLTDESVRRAGTGPEGHGSLILLTFNCNTRSCG